MFINSIYIKNQKTKQPKKNKKKQKKTNQKNQKKTIISRLVWKTLFFFGFFGLFVFFVFLFLMYILFINISGVYKHSRFEFTAFV